MIMITKSKQKQNQARHIQIVSIDKADPPYPTRPTRP